MNLRRVVNTQAVADLALDSQGVTNRVGVE
jgi:hypothetical protein